MVESRCSGTTSAVALLIDLTTNSVNWLAVLRIHVGNVRLGKHISGEIN